MGYMRFRQIVPNTPLLVAFHANSGDDFSLLFQASTKENYQNSKFINNGEIRLTPMLPSWLVKTVFSPIFHLTKQRSVSFPAVSASTLLYAVSSTTTREHNCFLLKEHSLGHDVSVIYQAWMSQHQKDQF